MTTDVKVAPLTVSEVAAAKRALRSHARVFAARVAPIYAILRWKWAGVRDSVPNEAEIRATLYTLVRDSYEVHPGNGLLSSTGGLTVAAQRDSDGTMDCRISFELEHLCDDDEA
jgi:hypothetical protein